MRRLVVVALGLPLGLVVLQQQLLLRQPPRLLQLRPSAVSQGAASLELRFSRPMDRASVAASSQLSPPLGARWLGNGSLLNLSLDPGLRLTGPIRLKVAGRDRRGQALAPSRWLWDPRPQIVAVVPVQGGEQVQRRDHGGRWRPISPIWPRITALEPLGDGTGVAVVSQGRRDGGPAGQQIWRLKLQPEPQRQDPLRHNGLSPMRLGNDPVLFAHLSSNRLGELLIQSGGLEPASAQTLLWPSGGGSPQALELQASGPMRLLPQGGAVVVPGEDALTLQDLPPRPPRQQSLPGSRDLSSFCPRGGRALLVRHWPDYRRSLELVGPGQAPRQLWIGTQAVLASSCQGSGERLWLALSEGIQQPLLTVLTLDRSGTVLARKTLQGWQLEPGTPLSLDSSRQQLLLVLRPLGSGSGRVALMDAQTLQLHPLSKAARLALWLPARSAGLR